MRILNYSIVLEIGHFKTYSKMLDDDQNMLVQINNKAPRVMETAK